MKTDFISLEYVQIDEHSIEFDKEKYKKEKENKDGWHNRDILLH